jgi:thymidylate kinase
VQGGVAEPSLLFLDHCSFSTSDLPMSSRNTLSTARYIVVEGPIGVGKTSLTRRLADYLDGQVLLDQPEVNPFLTRFYQDQQRFALATQISFLFQRVDQLRKLPQPDLMTRPVVADFLLEKDALFALLTLSEDEYGLYRKIYEGLAPPQPPTPSLVIYLQAAPETLIARVRKRGWNRCGTRLDADDPASKQPRRQDRQPNAEFDRAAERSLSDQDRSRWSNPRLLATHQSGDGRLGS